MADNGNGTNNDGNNRGDKGQDAGDPVVQAITSEGLLRANLEAGVPADEAIELSRPRNWLN